MKRLYLCRHGETEWSRSGQHTGATDLSLTEIGKQQAQRLRQRLESISVDAVFSSPKKRALETCEGFPVQIEPLAVEWDYGDYEGLTRKQIEVSRPGWDLYLEGAPNGESPLDVKKRADELLEKLQIQPGNIALFSHGHFLKVLAARFLGLSINEGRLFSLSVASLSILGYDRGAPILELWNENGSIS